MCYTPEPYSFMSTIQTTHCIGAVLAPSKPQQRSKSHTHTHNTHLIDTAIPFSVQSIIHIIIIRLIFKYYYHYNYVTLIECNRYTL